MAPSHEAPLLAMLADAAVFVRRCMAYVGCAMVSFDTLAEAAAVYGIALAGLLGELHRAGAGERGGEK